MNTLFLIIVFLFTFFLLIKLLMKPDRDRPESAAETYSRIKKMQGIVPGGMYQGIGFIPGDPNGEWIRSDKYGLCPACENGYLFYYRQNEYYKLRCDYCGYLHDTGRQLTPEEKGLMDKTIAEIHESERLQ